MTEHTALPTSSAANPAAMVYRGNARFTILTSRLIRTELSASRTFEDRASQVFWYRDQPVPPFEVREWEGGLEIETEDLLLRYTGEGRFNHWDLSILLKSTGAMWACGTVDNTNLLGTARTLDSANGPVTLQPGLVSRSGWAVVDDSQSLVFDEHGWLTSRGSQAEDRDLYFFGYAQEFLGAIQDYQEISGKPGLLPRWALGNWWSRYWAYTQQELLNQMYRFTFERIPLSVCIIDMDWHLTQTGNQSSGWTGYTWNRDLFPDPDGLIRELHALNLKTALNLHPAEGIHPHESQYPAMADAMGVDPQSQAPIPFDITSPIFTRAYFKLLHHPYETRGIDFWWMDWQQGTRSKTTGLDPLYWLNHLHYYDLGRTPEKRPFIFSRWPGLGGHRYPIGFSGDTIVSWESLEFQPYMTSTAANVAFGWWSHDIGGHCEGVEDADLYLRWVQYGVFSPILRLHATNSPYIDRSPWGFDLDTLEYARTAMQLRHQLVPLLYSANQRNAATGEPVILPMYYEWADDEQAYHCPQQYLFCRQLLAAPFTRPEDPNTRLSRQVVWLPEGDWYDFFSGEQYPGGQWYAVYGTRADIPVFARAGAILPLDADGPRNGVSNPESFKVKVFTGADNTFELYEDDGESQAYLEGHFCTTRFQLTSNEGELVLEKEAAAGDLSLIPGSRAWIFEVYGTSKPAQISVTVNGESYPVEASYHAASHHLEIGTITSPSDAAITLRLEGLEPVAYEVNPMYQVEHVIRRAKMPSFAKQVFMRRLPEVLTNPAVIYEIAHELTKSQMLAVYEALIRGQSEPISRDIDEAFERLVMALRDLPGQAS